MSCLMNAYEIFRLMHGENGVKIIWELADLSQDRK